RSHPALYVAMADAAAADPEIGAIWASLRQSVGDVVSQQLRDERRAGIATDGPDAGPYVEMLLGMMNKALEHEARRGPGRGSGARHSRAREGPHRGLGKSALRSRRVTHSGP